MNSQNQPAVSAATTAIDRLSALKAELAELGYRTRLDQVIGSVPSLYVQNPEGGHLKETIYAAPLGDGWAFWWSWAEPVAGDADDVGAAAARIARVLRVA